MSEEKLKKMQEFEKKVIELEENYNALLDRRKIDVNIENFIEKLEKNTKCLEKFEKTLEKNNKYQDKNHQMIKETVSKDIYYIGLLFVQTIILIYVLFGAK